VSHTSGGMGVNGLKSGTSASLCLISRMTRTMWTATGRRTPDEVGAYCRGLRFVCGHDQPTDAKYEMKDDPPDVVGVKKVL
jgi:hypothetical protein